MRLSGGEVIARALKDYGVEYVAAIPGHGSWAMLDAFMQPDSTIPVIQVFHEQSAVHLADGYYRATGRPMAAMTSVGPGATNTLIGLATAYAESSSLLLLTGSPPLHMHGHGTMQELDRQRDNDFPSILRPVTKRGWEATAVEELPSIMHRAFSAMLTGRPGPVHVEVPMDVQAAMGDVTIHGLDERLPHGRPYPDPKSIEAAAELLEKAERPVIVVGGGAISSDSTDEVFALAEAAGCAVVATYSGKGSFPEDHPLFAGAVGYLGTAPGNQVAANADVVVSVGCRFVDWDTSSYRQGTSFSFPPAKLIHIDIDPHEIGKNYPAAVGIFADAKAAVGALVDAVPRNDGRVSSVQAEVADLRRDWDEQTADRVNSEETPFTTQRPLRDLRRVMPRDGILVCGSGNAQGAVKQSYPAYLPRTHMTPGGYSSMGWAVPAAIGAKLGRPDRKVVAFLGDGDFMMTMQELAVCATNNLPVTFVVINNSGFISIRGGQRKLMGRHVASEFSRPDGSPYSPDFEAIAKNFGINSFRPTTSDALEPMLKEAIDSDEPALVEVPVSRDAAGPWVPGWWDLPIPGYVDDDESKAEYDEGKAQEQHV